MIVWQEVEDQIYIYFGQSSTWQDHLQSGTERVICDWHVSSAAVIT